MTDISVDVAIIGAGTAGLYALREVRRARKSFVLIDRGPLGTTCARTGCMPSKAAIQAAEDWHRRGHFATMGILGGDGLDLDRAQAWQHVRGMRDRFAGRAAEKAVAAAGENLVRGEARFREPTILEVDGRIIRAGAVVLATGSEPVLPRWLEPVRSRVITTDDLFELTHLPESLAVLGLGAIGLELGQALARLGVAVTGFELRDMVGGLTDPAVAARAAERIGQDLPMALGRAAEVAPTAKGVRVSAGDHAAEVELVLAAMGRAPRVRGLGLEDIGAPLDERGLPVVNPASMRLGELPIYVAGDANGDRLIMHEAADEGAIAGYNAAHGAATRFRRKTPLAIAFTDPNIAVAGASFDALDENAVIGEAETSANGRSLILGGQGGVVRVYADRRGGRLLGGAVLAKQGEHLGHHLAWAIQRGDTVFDLLRLPFYHPVVEEALQAALQDAAAKLDDKPRTPLNLEPEEE